MKSSQFVAPLLLCAVMFAAPAYAEGDAAHYDRGRSDRQRDKEREAARGEGATMDGEPPRDDEAIGHQLADSFTH